jgi:hypothetical protein
MSLQTTAAAECFITYITGKRKFSRYDLFLLHNALEKKTNIRINLHMKRNESEINSN